MNSLRFEQFREWLAFKIYPEARLYNKVNYSFGELNENYRVVKLIEQSAFKNKKAVIDLVKTRLYTTEEIMQSLDDASKDQTSSDAS